MVDSTGGVGDSGVLKLTTAENSQLGSFLIDDLDAGAAISAFTATFKLLIGGGNGADGFSFNFANDLPGSFGEEGAGTGLTVSFDVFDNGGGEAPAIDLKNGGTVIVSTKGVGALIRQNKFIDVRIEVKSDGTLSLSVDNQLIYTNFPGAFTASAGQFGLGARTGGLNDNHWVDNLSITTSTGPATQPSHPLIISVSPSGPVQVNPNVPIIIQVQDFATQLNTNSITLQLNGTPVAASITKTGAVTTIQYQTPALLPSASTNTFRLIYSDNGSTVTTTTNDFSFRVIRFTNIVLPAPIFLETFEGVTPGGIPTGWSVTNNTDSLNAGIEIGDPKSDAYLDWLVITRQQVFDNGTNEFAVWEAGDPDGRVTHIAPGQLVNGVVLSAADLMVGKFLYAESDERGGNQVQTVFTSDYNLTGRSNLWVSFHSSYIQNQDSIASLEYSIDGGANWLPILYMLDDQNGTADVHRFPDGTVDAVDTLETSVDGGAAYGLNYGAFIGAPITQALAPYISGRINDDSIESHRVEIFPLPAADNQAKVRFRFMQAGTGSWYWGIDNFGIYSIPPAASGGFTSITHSGNSVVIAWSGGKLQSADAVSGPWTPMPSATSPLTVTLGVEHQKFYRLVP